MFSVVLIGAAVGVFTAFQHMENNVQIDGNGRGQFYYSVYVAAGGLLAALLSAILFLCDGCQRQRPYDGYETARMIWVQPRAEEWLWNGWRMDKTCCWPHFGNFCCWVDFDLLCLSWNLLIIINLLNAYWLFRGFVVILLLIGDQVRLYWFSLMISFFLSNNLLILIFLWFPWLKITINYNYYD